MCGHWRPGRALLLLDEPFTALNESLRREFWRLLKTLRAGHDFTMLMITHDLAEGFFMADRVTVLIDGRVEQVGDKEEVWRRPATLPVAKYLGIRNTFPATVVGVEAGEVLVDCPALGGRLLSALVQGRPAPAVGTELASAYAPSSSPCATAPTRRSHASACSRAGSWTTRSREPT